MLSTILETTDAERLATGFVFREGGCPDASLSTTSISIPTRAFSCKNAR